VSIIEGCGPIPCPLIVPQVARNPKSSANRAHRRWEATCRIAEFWIAVRVSLYHFGRLKKITGVACRIGKSLRKRVERFKISYPLDWKAATIVAIESQSEVAVKPKHPYATAVWWVALLAVVPSMCAQEAAAPRHTGVPQDWSQGHVVFSRDTLALYPNLMDREPRVLHQVMQRWQPPNLGVFQGSHPLPTAASNSGAHRDWSVSPGGRLSPFRYAAKFSFDPNAPPDCINDYVVFGLASSGVTGGRANLVAYNNLYSDPVNGGGLCDPPIGPGLGPQVRFAYNITTAATTGKIVTSPILSEDGTKIGFVESIPGTTPTAVFHVLTWTAGQGTPANAAAPTSMLSVPLSLTATAYDSASSPWIDYSADIVYVGSDNGLVYKITGVFHGIPTLSGAPTWPVQAGTLHLTSPVLDSVRGELMVGSADGNLFGINTATGALSALPVGAGPSSGIVAPPIVDVTNGTTFVVSANDGTSAVLVEADTGTMLPLSTGRVPPAAPRSTSTPQLSATFTSTLPRVARSAFAERVPRASWLPLPGSTPLGSPGTRCIRALRSHSKFLRTPQTPPPPAARDLRNFSIRMSASLGLITSSSG
jgi:hypothetical protein